MTFIETMLHSFFPKFRCAHITTEAQVENAVFDLKQETRANIATTKLLDSVLQRSAAN